MLLETERKSVVEFGKKMLFSGLTTGTGGNLSIFNKDKKLIAISPSGIGYSAMKPSHVVVTDGQGKVKQGNKKPSSEINFHLGLYETRPDISAIIHTHSPYATTIACMGLEIPPVHYLVGFSGKKVPIAPYETFGTKALARKICETVGSYNAVLLENHGLIAMGKNINMAFTVAEEIEFVARIYFQAKACGVPKILPDKEMERVMEKFKSYGQKQ
jgi:L-fuculose-phosphate aldolase